MPGYWATGGLGMKWTLPPRIEVCEVGPRDGLQNEVTLLTVAQKVELIDRVVEHGARRVEIGSFVNPRAVPAMADTDAVARQIRRPLGVEYRVLVANLKGLERSLAVEIRNAKLTASASVAHSLRNLGRTPPEVMGDFATCAAFARAEGMQVTGAISTAFGCPYEGEVPLAAVRGLVEQFLSMGVQEISLSDTIGTAHPGMVYAYCMALKDEYPSVLWTLHFHNTRGLALANVLAGLQAGVTRYDAAFAGLGGCPFAPGATGNLATEDLINMAHSMGVASGYDLEGMLRLGLRVQELVGHTTDSAMLRVAAAGRK